jgi:hypothetical protein
MRVVYAGRVRSMEIPYNRLLANHLSDGIEFNQSNRATAALFRFGTKGVGPVVAATVNAAVQKQLNDV